MRGMTYPEKIQFAKSKGIMIPDRLSDENVLSGKENIVGIYKFIAYNEKEEVCFYIGKATNILARLFLPKSAGHIFYYLKYFVRKETITSKIEKKIGVARKIDKYRNVGYQIKVEIKETDYHDTNFSRAAHKLALMELQEIVKYQEQGQCLWQLPEGVGAKEETFWEKHYKNPI